MKHLKILGRTLNITLVFLLVGCGGMNNPPVFDDLFKKKRIDLSNHLGQTFTILSKLDTSTIEVDFDHNTRMNYLVETNGDTVIECFASKLGGLLLLNRKRPDGTYEISAVRVNDSTITGFNRHYAQLYLTKSIIQSGSYSDLISDTSSQFVLSPNKKSGKRLFSQILDSLESDKLISNYWKIDEEAIASLLTESSSTIAKNNSPILKVYPNPVSSKLTIETGNSIEKFEFLLSDPSGRILRRGVLLENGATIDLNELAPGAYFLIVPETDQTIKVIKVDE